MKISPASIPEAFDQTAIRFRDRSALAGDAVELTYGQLGAKADRIGHWLRARGIVRGHTVGLFAQRSVDTIAAMLGILPLGMLAIYTLVLSGFMRIRWPGATGSADFALVLFVGLIVFAAVAFHIVWDARRGRRATTEIAAQPAPLA